MRNLDPLAIWYLVLFGLFVPYLAFRSTRRIRAGMAIPPKHKILLNTLLMELLFAGVALFAARARDINVFARGEIGFGAVGLTSALTVGALCMLPLIWNATPADVRRRMLLSRPQKPGELGWWFLVSLAAGTVEEIVYRGVMFALLLPITANWTSTPIESCPVSLAGGLTADWWLAVTVCIAAFVLGHWGQGWMRAVFLAAFSLGCHILVRMTGSLYPAMAFHFVYDFLAGVIYIRLARSVMHSAS